MRTWTKSDVNVDKKRCKRGQKAMQTWTKSDVVFRIYPKKEKVCEFISKN
ncbi:TPA: hypothetical protein ACY4E4_002363 [Enterococcus faecium]|nr:hypothetical protein [Enterococcus faecium]MBJ1573807.1 hypothetical protein [Enterococcus faecium]MBJ1647337.1 hypothetical protein [Enterococcus faecium]MCF8626166.1 hypothetical protein [Enterococcus faecium]MCF8655524.1 hypothetical protein [Enterococcus faecium]MCF8690256.1 hypothetical protein [Enterococcus faecium]